MAVEIKMPQLGESVHEGTIGKWLRAEGDSVEKYEPLLEVITDKVDTEITASHSGTILKIVVPEGETVQVGTVLAFIGEAGEALEFTDATSTGPVAAALDGTGATPPIERGLDVAGPASESLSRPSEVESAPGEADPSADAGTPRVSPVAARVAADHDVDPSSVVGTGRGGQVTRQDVERYVTAAADSGADSGDPVASGSAAPGESAAQGPSDDIGFISPRVARLAAQHGVNLRLVNGSGRDGRISSRDVEAYVASSPTTSAVSTAPLGTGAKLSQASEVPASQASGVPAAPERQMPPATKSGRSTELVDEILSLSPMRRAIAAHMVNSVRTSPHVTTVHEVDMSIAMAAYRAERDAFAERGVRLTITAIIIDAVARAIAQHPLTNSSWTDAGIKLHREINIGMAVAVPDGLIVPVIRNADERSLVGIARDVSDLAERARDKKLVVDDVQGGTFTITNYGTLGSLFGTPVINQPQCAIMGAGTIKKRVVVMESDAGDTIAIRPMMYLALTFDHRILDGATADPFMQSVIENLEHYEIR